MSGERESWRRQRRQLDFSEGLAQKGWFHSFRLPDGTFYDGHLSLDELERRVGLMPIPAELSGRRVLDIGAWDGWFSFEMERRGASVVAIDCVEVKNFRKIRAALGSKVDYRVADIHQLELADAGRFDVVLFLSVLYHLKHPLLALEKVCALTTDVAIVSSFITDDYTRPVQELLAETPRLEFYETDELGGHLDNWFGPNLASLTAMCRAAGFARVELIEIAGHSAMLACHRKWLPSPPKRIVGATNNRNGGINFRSQADEYISCWFEGGGDPKVEVDGYGLPCLFLTQKSEDVWQCNVRLPPGLDPGWHSVGLGGNTAQIAVDMPLVVESLVCQSACDAFSWQPNVIGKGVSVWIAGLPANADRANVRVFLGAHELAVDAVKDTQVNAMLTEPLAAGVYPLTVSAGGVTSQPMEVAVIA
jgi:tRNA (mo5U34)-methyltransferase